ncbi:MAG: helix-turn-helix transcriptional regulator [Rhodothermus sp.]|nr:helix-turn-helix transcriptional regulator [Rhodothermus sp.]
MSTWTLVGSETKRHLLQLMKRRGRLTLDEAVTATGLTRSTLREHLMQLERDGLVQHATERQKRGRPRLLYRLTPAGERLFPNRDGELLARLLQFLKAEGAEKLLQRFFEQYWNDRLQVIRQRLKQAQAHTLEDRLAMLRDFLEEEGFMPEIVFSEQGLEIRECNCPFAETVRHTRLPCYLEARFFERLLGQKAKRVAYIPESSPACRYTFNEHPSNG